MARKRRTDRRRPPRRQHLRSIPSHEERPGGGSAPDQELFQGLRQALRSDHPVELLEGVSTLLAVVDPRARNPFEPNAEPAVTLTDLVDSFVGTDYAETTAALTVIRSMVEDELLGSRIGKVLTTRRQPMPPWLGTIDEVAVPRVVMLTHILGDGDDYLLDARLPGGSTFTALVYVDHNLGTVVKDAFVIAEDLEEVLAKMGEVMVDADQELVASGAANVASGLFGGLGVAGSLSKTAAVSDARGRTQIAGLAAAGLAVIVIAALAPALSGLPRAVLSAIVVNAVWKLMDFGALRRYHRVRRNDIVAAVIAAVGVLAFGPLNGLLLAVAGSVIGLVFRSTRVDVEVMGKVPHEKSAWGSIRNHAERSRYPGVIVLRLNVPLFWVTAAPANDIILALVDSTPGTRALVLDMEATNQMDTTSADALADLLAALRRRDVDLFLVRVMWPVRKALRRSGLISELGEDHLWHSISQGVREARRAHGLLDLPAHTGAPPPDGTSTDGASTDGTSTDGTSTDGTSTDEPLDADDEEHIVARDPGPDPPDQRRQGSL